MAIIKIVPVKVSPKKNLEYITNAEKTNYGLLVEGVNTYSNPIKADHEMEIYREQYGRLRKNAVFHLMHSFSNKDKLDPVTAHEISLKIMKEILPADAMYVMATHTNTDNLHTHVTVNTVTKSGKSISFSKAWCRKAVATSNKVCREHGLIHSIVGETPPRKRINHYAEWKASNGAWKEIVRKDIDCFILKSRSIDDFYSLLDGKGYTLKQGKSGMMIKAPGQERFISLHRLGTGYSVNTINNRIKRLDMNTDLRYIKESQMDTMFDAIHILTVNENVDARKKELLQEYYKINKSDNSIDKTRCMEIKRELAQIKYAEDYIKNHRLTLEERIKMAQLDQPKDYKEREMER